ncbi:alpha-hydroxyketone-type quorum-sensing autoinducer synthase [Variovorax sp. KK3]|uniref:alpha-hydroxyketone-type quorum-sensing autoinducer synthase n=1 Tax=Variovorax sp. KK3 TaxID=1855728 RepID=UPI00097BAC70|nr:alpha-hydroxyketone-type quorum-sensing autoinducer synthase [Variovorax sp. KK3]
MADISAVPSAFNSCQPSIPSFLQDRIERYYQERVRDSWNGGHIMRGRVPGIDALHLSSNDYLSISRHPKIVSATADSVLQHGNGAPMSGIFLHGASPQLELEKRLASFMQAEAGVLCQSGWCANTGLIQAIASSNTPVFADVLAHNSLWEGIRSSGAKPVTIFHNDADHLERQVRRYGPGVVVVDSIYSTNGSVCPLVDFSSVCDVLGCVLVVDESHSLGTHGPRGEGMVASMGLINRVHFRTASLAKAFAGRAGFITCSERFSDYFKFESRPAIFSSTLLPHEIAGLNATLDIVRCEGWRRDLLHSNAGYLRSCLEDFGYNLGNSESQIIALESGSEHQTIALRDALEAKGIFGSVFCAPATPRNRSLMRFSVNAALSKDDLERIARVCRDIRHEVKLTEWPSSRRKRQCIPPKKRVMFE